MKRNLSGVNLRILPKTEAKAALIEANKSSIELFIQDFIIDFTKGFIVDDVYEYYVRWISKYGSEEDKKNASKPEMGRKMIAFCDKKQKRIKGRGTKNVYFLMDEKKKYFDLDKYRDDEDIEDSANYEEEKTTNDSEYNEKYEDFKDEISRIKVRK